MITIETRALVRGIETVGLAVERRNTIPVLSGIRIKPDAGGIRLSGMDMDMQVDAQIPAEMNGSAFETVLLEPRMLATAARRAAASQIGLEEVAGGVGRVAASCGRFDYTWGTLPTEDWPDMDAPRSELVTATLGSEFIDALRRVRPCVSEEETRYYLNGVYLHGHGLGDSWTAAVAATDGHRLTRIGVAMPDCRGELPGIIIPRKTVDVVLAVAKARPKEAVHFTISTKLPRNSEEPVTTTAPDASKLLCEFQIGNVRILSKLIDGQFPEYSRVIPADNLQRATFARADLIQAAQALRFSVKARGGTALKAVMKDGTASLSSAWEDSAVTGRSDVAYEGNATDFTFGVNARYLVEALAAYAPQERVTLAFAEGDARNCPITIVSPEDGHALSVLMPMRV